MKTVEFNKGKVKHILKVHPDDGEFGLGKTNCKRLVWVEEINDEEVDSLDEMDNPCDNCRGRPPGHR